MVDIQNWDAIPDAVEYERPVPGGYIGVICDYLDVETPNRNGKSQFLQLFWDFAEGPLQGSNNECSLRMNFWPSYGKFVRSYKESALSQFKAFKTCLELSNPRYVFNTRNLDGMKGRLIGVVLGEEEYEKNDGTVGTRLYVKQVRTVQAIRDGDFKVPDLKKLKQNPRLPPAQSYGQQPGFSYGGGFAPLPDESDIPF